MILDVVTCEKVIPTKASEKIKNKINNIFSDFKAQPLASASIAQVHAAQLKNGRDVIVKVVRPGIHKAIEKDLLLMKKIAEFLTSLSEVLIYPDFSTL